MTTLRKGNVAIDGAELEFRFVGKGGIEQTLSLHDVRAARTLRRCHELPGQHLFGYVDAHGTVQAVTSHDINCALEELTSQKFTAKDFRTWVGTLTAFTGLLELGTGPTAGERTRIVNEVSRRTAGVLGNTVAVCKRYYIHPLVVESYLAGELAHLPRVARASRGLSREESMLARFLQRRPQRRER